MFIDKREFEYEYAEGSQTTTRNNFQTYFDKVEISGGRVEYDFARLRISKLVLIFKVIQFCVWKI